METIKSPRLALLLAASLGLAGGCAQIPRLDPPPSIRKVDELGSSSSFAVKSGEPPVSSICERRCSFTALAVKFRRKCLAPFIARLPSVGASG